MTDERKAIVDRIITLKLCLHARNNPNAIPQMVAQFDRELAEKRAELAAYDEAHKGE